MVLTKAELKKLPKIIGDEAENQMEYVQAVLGGQDKVKAFRIFFPQLYEDAVKNAKGNKGLIPRNITTYINSLERKSAVKKMYELAHRNAWTNFMVKKHRLYENLYDMAMDEENSVRDRQSCSKTLLDHMPKFEEDKTIILEVKDGKDEFVKGLREMQIALHKQANKDKDIIEAEIDDGQ